MIETFGSGDFIAAAVRVISAEIRQKVSLVRALERQLDDLVQPLEKTDAAAMDHSIELSKSKLVKDPHIAVIKEGIATSKLRVAQQAVEKLSQEMDVVYEKIEHEREQIQQCLETLCDEAPTEKEVEHVKALVQALYDASESDIDEAERNNARALLISSGIQPIDLTTPSQLN
jgi:hypothetical protein